MTKGHNLKVIPGGRVASGGGGDHTDGMTMEQRVARIEGSLERIEPVIVRLDERSSHAATKEDLAKLEGHLDGLEGSLSGKIDALQGSLSGKIDNLSGALSAKPGKGFVVATMIAIVGLVLAAIAVAPYLRQPLGG